MSILVSPRNLVEGCLEPDGVADLDLVYDVGIALGLAEQPVRLAIRRMQAGGELVQVGRGRRGRIEATSAAKSAALLDDRLIQFAFTQDAGKAPWDALWRLYGFSIPEADRAERDALRAALQHLGAAPVIPGLYASPHELEEELRSFVPGVTVDTRLVVVRSEQLRVGDVVEPAAIAERLWPAVPTIAAYEPLDRELADIVIPDRADHVATMALRIRLREGFARALAADPLLPAELRTTPWPPATIRRRFLEAWSALAPHRE